MTTTLGMGLTSQDFNHDNPELDALADLMHQSIQKKDAENFLTLWKNFESLWKTKGKKGGYSGDDIFRIKDAYGFRESALVHFSEDMAHVVFNNVPPNGSGDFGLYRIAEIMESDDRNKIKTLSPEALKFLLLWQKNHLEEPVLWNGKSEYEKFEKISAEILQQTAVTIMASPLVEHAPWRKVLLEALPDEYNQVLKNKKYLAKAMSGWGKRDRDALNSDINLDANYIESLIPYMGKAWPLLFQAYEPHISYGATGNLRPQSPETWEVLVQAFPRLKDSLDTFFEKAKLQNEERWNIIKHQWKDGLPFKDLEALYGVAKWQTSWQNYEVFSKMPTYRVAPAWFLHFLGPGIPVNKKEWRDRGYIVPPERLFTSLAETFLVTKSGFGYKSFLETHPEKFHEISSFDKAPFVLSSINSITQADFIDLIKKHDFNDWRMDEWTVAHYFAARNNVTSLAFAQNVYKNYPEWFEDGSLIALLRTNGMKKENEVKFSQENLKRSLRAEGIKIATKATKKPQRLM